MRIEEIKKSDLDNIDMNHLSNAIISDEHRNYFLNSAGQEHYRLLSYLSINNFSETFVDVGTFKGCSALAFSANEKVQVNSFNIVDELDLNLIPQNINFYIDDVTKSDFLNKVVSSKIIFLDTLHDGIFERYFMNYLDDINYRGVLILDDIHYFGDLTTLWSEINKEKYDITDIGHWSGTGLVYYN